VNDGGGGPLAITRRRAGGSEQRHGEKDGGVQDGARMGHGVDPFDG